MMKVTLQLTIDRLIEVLRGKGHEIADNLEIRKPAPVRRIRRHKQKAAKKGAWQR